jgi:hypothetical protein
MSRQLRSSRSSLSSSVSASLGVSLVASLLALGAGCSDGDDGEDPPPPVRADNGVLTCGKPLVYLNFGPVQLTKGAVEDSRTNVTDNPEAPDEGYSFPAYASAADQAALTKLIDDLAGELGIPVVHERPARGDYFMLVVVDDFYPGFQGGRTAQNCGHANPNTIGIVNTMFYSFHGGIEFSLHGAMLMLGRSVGLDPVEVGLARGNCMVNNAFLDSCMFGQVQAAQGPCSSDGVQDQLLMLSALSCKK